MRAFTSQVQRFLSSEDGPTAVEYAVMVALIIVACIASVGVLGTKISGMFSGINTKLVIPS